MPCWARPGLRGCEAGGGVGAELGGSSCGSSGVSAAAASAGMCLGRSSLKCGASHSLTPASLPRRAAAAGALPFLVSHSLTRPPFSLLLLLRARPVSPALLGRAHPPRLRPGSSHSASPAPDAATSVSDLTEPQTSPEVVVWRRVCRAAGSPGDRRECGQG